MNKYEKNTSQASRDTIFSYLSDREARDLITTIHRIKESREKQSI